MTESYGDIREGQKKLLAVPVQEIIEKKISIAFKVWLEFEEGGR